MGRDSQGHPRVHVYKGDRTFVSVGNHVSIEPDVDFLIGGNHRIDWVTTYPLREFNGLPGSYQGNPYSNGDIIIRSGASIGRGAKILSGITIGEGAVVGPFSVVARDVRPFAVVLGNPAREIRRRFEDDVVESLLTIDWLTWPVEKIMSEFERVTGTAPSGIPTSRTRSLDPVPEAVDGMSRRNPQFERVRGFASRGLRALARIVDSQGAVGRPTTTDSGSRAETVTRGRASRGIPAVHGSDGHVTIGNYSSIGRGCEVLLDPRSVLGDESSHGAPTLARRGDATLPPADVSIGSDVWIGRQAKILPGIAVGDGAVVGAWSVVTTDVAPFSIVAGNPAREIRRRFDDATIAALLRIRWWDWPEEEVLASWEELCSPDLSSFITRHDPLRTEHAPLSSGDGQA
jgi:chloramphenicol O-acetyltransferase type B